MGNQQSGKHHQTSLYAPQSAPDIRLHATPGADVYGQRTLYHPNEPKPQPPTSLYGTEGRGQDPSRHLMVQTLPNLSPTQPAGRPAPPHATSMETISSSSLPFQPPSPLPRMPMEGPTIRSNSPGASTPTMKKPVSVKLDIGPKQRDGDPLKRSVRSARSQQSNPQFTFTSPTPPPVLAPTRSVNDTLHSPYPLAPTSVTPGPAYFPPRAESQPGIHPAAVMSFAGNGFADPDPFSQRPNERQYTKVKPNTPQNELFSDRVAANRFNGRKEIPAPISPRHFPVDLIDIQVNSDRELVVPSADAPPHSPFRNTLPPAHRPTEQSPLTFSFMPPPAEEVIGSVNWDWGRTVDSEVDLDKRLERWKQAYKAESEFGDQSRSSHFRRQPTNGSRSPDSKGSPVTDANPFYQRVSGRLSLEGGHRNEAQR